MQPPDPFVATLQEWIEVSMHRSMCNFVRYSRDIGLSMPQLGALFHISRMGSRVTDLGEHLGVSSAAASQMLDHLVQQGLISRAEDPSDRRVKQLSLTEKGQQILQESIHARQAWLDELASALSKSEIEKVHTALEILISKAKNLGPLDN